MSKVAKIFSNSKKLKISNSELSGLHQVVHCIDTELTCDNCHLICSNPTAVGNHYG